MNKFPTILNTPKKIIFFSLRLTWALAVLVVVCFVWVVLFALFLPFILLAVIIAGRSNQVPSGLTPQQVDRKPDDDGSIPLVFDRRQDISKLFGCNTRNVQYRWNLFSSRIEQILKRHEQPKALDFGAGSLRDSYELARLGFCVTSVDLDPAVMDRYFKSYDWVQVHRAPTIFTAPIETLRDSDTAFHLAIAFDVIEHLEDPSHYCHSIHSLLREDGLLFSIVPNRRSIFERYFRHSIKKQKAKGIPLVPGVPHLQFKLPSEWEALFEQCGFRILEHDMAIGFFVNDCWNGLLGLPLRVYVTPVLARLAQGMGMKFNEVAFEERFSPPWLMKYVDVLDQLCKKQLGPRFGWNLIVASKQ